MATSPTGLGPENNLIAEEGDPDRRNVQTGLADSID
jgi:hypothetical protein